MKLATAKFLIILILASCGFTSGLYEDILKAQELTNEHKFSQASDLYKKILLKKPALNVKTKVYFQLAEINSIFLNKPKEAIKDYEKVIEISSDPLWHVKAIEKIAQLNFEVIKDYSKAIKAYNKLIEFRPKLEKNDQYQFQVALSYFYKRDFEKSRTLFKEFLNKKRIS
jgi:tetratricopeptide (TPR) repeat protein